MLPKKGTAIAAYFCKPPLKFRLTTLFSFLCVPISLVAQVKFVANKGQWDSHILYTAQLGEAKLFIEKNSLTYALWEGEPFHQLHKNGHYDKPINAHSYKVIFDGANTSSYAEGALTLEEYHNYYLGANASKWAARVPVYGKLWIKNLYPGIDLEILGNDGSISSLKYNFHIAPGADPALIRMRLEGLDEIKLKDKKLHLRTSVRNIVEQAPVAFQYPLYKMKTEVKVNYVLQGNTVSFDVGKYNSTIPMVIDPIVVFSSYTGSRADNFGFTATYDKDGHAYAGGTVYDIGYPVTPGAYQIQYRGGVSAPFSGDLARDAGISKFSPDGSRLIYATYLGGRHNEQPHSMVCNSRGELVVLGTTFSDDFPITAGAFDETHNGLSDIYLLTLSPDGTQLLNSTYVGGSNRDGLNGHIYFGTPSNSPLQENYGDEYRGEVIVDAADHILMVSCTESSPAMGFPVRNGFNSSFGGIQDGIVLKFNPALSNLIWGSYIGGQLFDAAFSIDLDASGRIFVAGGTNSNNLNFGIAGHQSSFQGGTVDGYLLRISADGRRIEAATFTGTNAYDQNYFVKIDPFGFPYVYGQTRGNYFTTPGVYIHTNGGQYITKYNPDLNLVLISTRFGIGTRRPQLSPTAFMVDECERVFVSGWGGETLGDNNTMAGMPVTPDAFQKISDGSDFWIGVFSKNLEDLVYATFLGGDRTADHVDGGTSRFDPKGLVYQSICASCVEPGQFNDDFPTTPGSYSPLNPSPRCNNAIFKLDFENLNLPPILRDTLITLNVGQTMNLQYAVSDPDKYDTIRLTFSGAVLGGGNVQGPFVTRSGAIAGRGTLISDFAWTPECQHARGDTFDINVLAEDEGCPQSLSSSAIIRITVIPPPPPKPPKNLCLEFETDNRLRIDLLEIPSDPYLKHYVVRRRDPQGNEVTLALLQPGETMVTDKSATGARNQNYCYYVYGVNICDMIGDTTYIICSKDQFENPIGGTEIVTVSVHENRSVMISWEPSVEDDFKQYSIYRKLNGSTKDYAPYKSITQKTQTQWEDLDVKVSSTSYCYTVIVGDQCGNTSAPSSFGCNIVLQGQSFPYVHQLNWSPYTEWRSGVQNYELIRWDDRTDKQVIHNDIAKRRMYLDENLDYDWGGYWYRVVAYENGGNDAISLSNDVYLIQKPLLHVPTAFTRNGDGLNENWGIVDVFVRDYHMQVYNRWGQLIFESRDKNQQWDGTFRGAPPIDNVFIWQVRYTGWDYSIHNQRGTLTILR